MKNVVAYENGQHFYKREIFKKMMDKRDHSWKIA